MQKSGSSGGEKRGVQSVEVSAQFLEALCSFPSAVPLKNIAEYCDIPASKAHRYMTSLVRIGLASQNEDTSYYDLGGLALRLGVVALSRDDVIRRAGKALDSLVSKTSTTGHLTIWGEPGPVVVRVEHGGAPIVSSLGLGALVPLLNSSTGHIFLSYMPRGSTKKLVARERARSKVDSNAIDDIRVHTLRNGYARVDGMLIPGLSAISGPVFHGDGSLAAALTLIVHDPMRLADGSSDFHEFMATLAQVNESLSYSESVIS